MRHHSENPAAVNSVDLLALAECVELILRDVPGEDLRERPLAGAPQDEIAEGEPLPAEPRRPCPDALASGEKAMAGQRSSQDVSRL